MDPNTETVEPEQPPVEEPPVRNLKKWLVISLVGLLVIGLGAAAWKLLKKPGGSNSSSSGNSSQNNQPAKPERQTVRLIATGDMIAHTAINQEAKQADGSYNYAPMLEQMKPFFDDSDVRFCTQAVPAGGDAAPISGYPVFNAPIEFVRDMAGLGCNAIGAASNHTNDKGQNVITAMLDAWDEQRGILAVTGANRSAEEQNKIRTFTVKGVRFALLSYTTYQNSKSPTSFAVNAYSSQRANDDLKKARDAADVIIVSMRWGTEYSTGINAYQEEVAKFLADHGADVILGHGPHVLEPVKKVMAEDGHEALVWYSIGNFLNAQLDLTSLFSGIAVMEIDPTSKEITEVKYLPIYMHYEWTAAEKQREDLLKRHNFKLVPLDQADSLLAQSQNDTTITEQLDYITNLLNKFTKVKIISSTEY